MLIAAIAVLTPVASIQAAIIVARADSRAVRHWLAKLTLPLPDLRIVVRVAPCPDDPRVAGCSAPGDIWLRPRGGDRAVLLHELGHQFDYRQPQWSRTEFEAINKDHRPWDSAPNGPAEQFAEAWMACASPALAVGRLRRGDRQVRVRLRLSADTALASARVPADSPCGNGRCYVIVNFTRIGLARLPLMSRAAATNR